MKTDNIQSKVISERKIPIEELSDQALEDIFACSPDWVCEHRPDWVKKNYPQKFH